MRPRRGAGVEPRPLRQARRLPFEHYSRTTPMSETEAQSIRVQAMIAHEQRNP